MQIKPLTEEEKKNLIIFLNKDQEELGKLYINKNSLSATLFQEISKLFPTVSILSNYPLAIHK